MPVLAQVLLRPPADFPIPVTRAMMLPGERVRKLDPEEGRGEAAVYAELRRLAARLLRGWPRDGTLQVSALVSEAYLKLGRSRDGEIDADELLRLACATMRSVLVDYVRARRAQRRAAPGSRVELADVVAAYEARAGDLAELDELRERLARFDPKMAQALDLHFFGGLTAEETAQQLHLSLRTFQRRWKNTKRWLQAETS
jgi:RNA polymerase sigma factor (TIGR02999 family)